MPVPDRFGERCIVALLLECAPEGRPENRSAHQSQLGSYLLMRMLFSSPLTLIPARNTHHQNAVPRPKLRDGRIHFLLQSLCSG